MRTDQAGVYVAPVEIGSHRLVTTQGMTTVARCPSLATPMPAPSESNPAGAGAWCTTTSSRPFIARRRHPRPAGGSAPEATGGGASGPVPIIWKASRVCGTLGGHDDDLHCESPANPEVGGSVALPAFSADNGYVGPSYFLRRRSDYSMVRPQSGECDWCWDMSLPGVYRC
jgi:hypothetical protein